jgi:short-subunit dehydrogenase
MDLKTYGPWALVAGASEGLGAAWAEALAKRGFSLVLFARRKEKLDAFAETLRKKYSVEIIPRAVDTADWDATKKIVEEIFNSKGGVLAADNLPHTEASLPRPPTPQPQGSAATPQAVDIGVFVYNAAFAPVGIFTDVAETDLAKAAAVNVRAPLLLSRLVAEKMLARNAADSAEKNGMANKKGAAKKRGAIILMSSLAGSQGSPRLATYAATKSFNAILAEGLWAELKPAGIDVLACMAGAVLTPGYGRTQEAAAPGTLPPEKVVEAAFKALGKKPVVVPGILNKIGRFFLMRLVPRSLAVKMMAANTKTLALHPEQQQNANKRVLFS